MTSDRPNDVGLQAERTALAWRRTALAVAGGAIVGARLTAPGTGAGALVSIMAGGLIAVLVWVTSGRRYRTLRRTLQGGGVFDDVTPPGAALAALATACALTGVLAASYILPRA